MGVTFDDVVKARENIGDAVIRTPTIKATRLSIHLGIDLYLKLENLQHTSAFKARGALNKLLSLTEEQRKKGVIACSAGNHAQGVAYNATRLGMRSVIVMPIGTPFNKIKRTEDFGAEVVLHGKNFDDSVAFTLQMAKDEDLTFVHPFDDEDVVAGQGTLGLEMMEQISDLDVVVVPIGGGGLIAGVATAVKGINPNIKVIGAQAENFDAVLAKRERREFTGGQATLAEGIAVKAPSENDIQIIDNLVDKIYSATEVEIEKAVFDLLSDEKLVAEGAAGAALAVIEKNIEEFKGKKVGMVLCGGNIDSRTLSTLIMRGLVRDGRVTRLRFEIDDTPGQLSDISRIIGEAGANVIEVIHQRMMQTVSLKRAELDIVVEARDIHHVHELVDQLKGNGFVVHVMREV